MQRDRERGQTVTEYGRNMCVRALALRLPHFDMLHICLTPHVTKSPRHGDEVTGEGGKKSRKCWKWQLTGKRAADD